MRIEVLGPIRVWLEGNIVDLGPAGQRAMLGLLAVASGQPMSRAELLGAVWGERPPPSAINIIQTRVKNLRRLLEPARRSHGRSATLPAVGDGYALHVPEAQVDLRQFRRLVAAAGAARDHCDPGRATDLLREALRLWRGRPMADVPLLATHPKVVALIEQRRKALAQYGELMIAAGSAEEVIPVLAEAVADDPLDEAACARLIRAYHAAGRRAQAFDTYHQTRRRLVDELGVDPGPELVAAHVALLGGGTGASQAMPAQTGPARPDPEPVATDRVAVTPDPSACRPGPAQLLADVASFTGRAGHLRWFDDLLDAHRSTMVICVLSGLAGVGQTALAAHWVHRVREQFVDRQLYVNLGGFGSSGTAMKSEEVMQSFLDAFRVPAEQMPTSQQALTGLNHSISADKRVLIVLDNVFDAEQVRPLLPGADGCTVVITSRNRLVSLIAAERAHLLTVDCPSGE